MPRMACRVPLMEDVLNAVNPLFLKYGYTDLQIVMPSKNDNDDMDLPF